MLCKRCQVTQCLSAVKVEADLIRKDASTVEFCQLVTFDQNRCYFFPDQCFPCYLGASVSEGKNLNHYMLIRISAPLPEPHDFKAESIVGMGWSKFIQNGWENNGNSDRLYFGGSKSTADGDCSHEIRRRLLLGRKVMTNLDSIFKSRDITLPTKVCLVKAMVFPVVMYECESWTIKKAEHWRVDAFEL